MQLKKTLAVVLSVLFVLSFAASAFAIHAEIPAETQAVVAKGTTQMTLGGLWRVRGWYRNNVLLNGSIGDHGSGSYYDQRVRLYWDAKVSPNVQGYVMLQGDHVWGQDGPNQKGDSLRWIQAWIQYTGAGLLGVPAGIKIGHMPLSLGHKTFFEHTTNGDDAIILFADPTKDMHIAGLVIKLDEDQFLDNTDDLDGYVALLTYRAGDHDLGVNGTLLLHNDSGLELYNIGLHAEGKIAGFGYGAEANFQFGDFTDEVDAEGWSIYGKANYMIDPVNIRAFVGYGSGDDDPLDGDNEQFETFLSDDVHYTLVYDYRAETACGSRLTGLCNTFVVGGGLDYNPTKNLSTKISGFWLQAAEDSPITDSDDLGWEVDAGLVYTVARNLKYYFDIGYFDADDFYENDEEVTLIRQQFILSF